uniref:Uncharacterized protein n=1 Tax=Brassica oleracea var. oleracea TaxID=109376 RepID=A0A0D3BSC2_BRAOL
MMERTTDETENTYAVDEFCDVAGIDEAVDKLQESDARSLMTEEARCCAVEMQVVVWCGTRR